MTEAYLAGRELQHFKAGSAQDAIFAAERLDGAELKEVSYRHCTFANMSFKKTEFESATFSNCVFISCYFRAATIQASSFVGCRFIDCSFPNTTFVGCDFRYATFKGCHIDFGRMESALPGEPNLRAELASCLAREADAVGASRDARLYRLEAIHANETHLWKGVRGATDWYQDHFPFPWEWAKALVRLLALRLNGALWGYGERAAVLVRNIALLVFGVFPVLLWLGRDGLRSTTPLEGADFVFLSLSNVLPVQGLPEAEATSNWTRALFISEAAIGVIAFGLFVTLLFRWLVRR